jgi:hypothetical protein
LHHTRCMGQSQPFEPPGARRTRGKAVVTETTESTHGPGVFSGEIFKGFLCDLRVLSG